MDLFKPFRRITGISTPIGGLSWDLSTTSSIPQYTQPVYLTWENDDEFVVFLRGNDRKLVALNLSLDASVATEKQHKIITANKEVFDQIRLCNLNDLAIPLPHRGSEFIYLKFHFCDPQYQVYSSGGTGVFTLPIKGIFEVLQTLHGGPSTIFHLKEVVAPIDIQVRAFGG